MVFLQYVLAPVCLLGLLACIGFALWCELWPWLGWRLKRLAWPYYRCELCVGQDPQHGCQCAYYDCIRPCVSPERWRVWLRRALRFIGVDSL
jgi:hypothetical protein